MQQHGVDGGDRSIDKDTVCRKTGSRHSDIMVCYGSIVVYLGIVKHACMTAKYNAPCRKLNACRVQTLHIAMQFHGEKEVDFASYRSMAQKSRGSIAFEALG